MKPTPEEWMNNTTSQRRYDWMGVTGYIYGYAKELSKEIKVADVGCSSGVALAGSQLCLNEKGIEMFTVGIDGSSKVGAKAKKNLSNFVPDYVLKVSKEHVGECDIVICVNTVRYATIPYWYQVINKCIEFLKPDGILITGISHSEELALQAEPYLRGNLPPDIMCPMKGVSGWVDRILYKMVPKDTRAMRRKDALRYAETVLEEWKRQSPKQKWWKETKIHLRKILFCEVRELLKFWALAANNMINKPSSRGLW